MLKKFSKLGNFFLSIEIFNGVLFIKKLNKFKPLENFENIFILRQFLRIFVSIKYYEDIWSKKIFSYYKFQQKFISVKNFAQNCLSIESFKGIFYPQQLTKFCIYRKFGQNFLFIEYFEKGFTLRKF